MPHYKDGTEAKLGDEVIGTGYNVKHPITGVVVGIKPGETSCNFEIAHIRARPLWGGGYPQLTFPQVDIEYGQADAFERTDLYERRLAREQDSAKRDELAGEIHEVLKEST